jgi:hypothetical protein
MSRLRRSGKWLIEQKLNQGIERSMEMIVIKGAEMPKNCVECNRINLQQAIDCQLIYSGCANCGRHPSCPLTEIVTCKDCGKGHRECTGSKKYCLWLGKLTEDNFYCADAERRE